MMIKKHLLMAAIAIAACSCGGQKSDNPLFSEFDTPYGIAPFSEITIDHYREGMLRGMEEQKAEIEAIINNPEAPTFENTIEAMERGGELLNNVAGIFYALNECLATDEMQQVAERIQPKMTAFSNDINLNPELFARVEAVWNSRESLSLTPEQRAQQWLEMRRNALK